MVIGITVAVVLVVGTVITINAVHDSKSKDVIPNGIVVTRNLDTDGIEYELPFMEGDEKSENSDLADRDGQAFERDEKTGSIPVDSTGLTKGDSSENHVPSDSGKNPVSNTVQTITPLTGTSVTSIPAAGTTNSSTTTSEQNSSSESGSGNISSPTDNTNNPSQGSDSIYEGDKSNHEMPLVIF